MKSVLNYKLYYFLGIGGIGMSALARYFKWNKKQIIGYDKTETELTKQLCEEGIECYYSEKNEDELNEKLNNYSPQDVLVIYTPAIPKDLKEWMCFRQHTYVIKKRAEVLSEIVNQHHCIAIAGTHGKTTTTALITHIFRSASKNTIAFVGGIMSNYHTNFIHELPSQDEEIYTIVEADEYDKSFLTLTPEVAVITSVDPDHLDIYHTHEHLIQSYQKFAENVRPSGLLLVNKSVDKFFQNRESISTFAVNLNGQIMAQNVQFSNHQMIFDLYIENNLFPNVALGIPGIHNVQNALAAIGVARHYKIPFESIFDALKTFTGVKRRFEFHIKTAQLVLIDDYAHHPEEMKSFLSAVKMLYPDKKITSIFQPHLYSRTRDFMEAFAEVLANYSDEIILLDIYPARELPIPGISSASLLDKIKHPNKKIIAKNELPIYLSQSHHEVILTIGAGDIDALIPSIKQQLIKEWH